MQNILITGGSGLIGRHLIKTLASNAKITVVSRQVTRTKRLFNDTLEVISLDQLTNVEQFDAIINLAGEPIADKRWSQAQKRKICDSRWDTTTKLVDLINISKRKPKVFISGSAIGIYGRQDDTPISEDFELYHNEFSRTVCEKWESIALKANTRTCLIRTGVVLDSTGGALAKMLMPFRLGLGGPIASGTQYMSWIHIDDMVRAICFLLNSDNCVGAYNLTAPSPNTNAYFSIKLAKRLGRPCMFRVPAFVLRYLMGESSDLVLFGQKVVPTRLINAGFHFNYPSLEEALDGLDI